MIRRKNTPFVVFQNRKLGTIILAFCWCAGLLVGCFFANRAGNIHFSMMRRAICASVSISGLVVVLLPFLFSAVAVFVCGTWVFAPLCFLKAFRFAYLSGLISASFGGAGWLIRLLLLFADGCIIPMLLWIWLRWFHGGSGKAIREIAICALFACIIWSIDYFVVSPFLGMLL